MMISMKPPFIWRCSLAGRTAARHPDACHRGRSSQEVAESWAVTQPLSGRYSAGHVDLREMLRTEASDERARLERA